MFQGRTDDMIKSRGYRVELGEIDTALLAIAGVHSAAAVAIPDEDIGNRIVAFCTVSDGVEVENIAAALKKRLPKYMVPEAIHIRDAMPRTSTNKIDRNALRMEVA